MNADLERTIGELGPAYRDVVARLRSSSEVEPSAAGRRLSPHPSRIWVRFGYLVAASLFAAISFCILFQESPAPRRIHAAGVYTVAYAPTEEALETIVASQRADGSWSNDFLTRQNAAALRSSSDKRMRIAYRRAVRYLRAKGLEPLTDGELKARGEFAAKALAT